ncbi:hypothetical protein FRX31_007046 [Thalictrum thalictroides]|uniref:Uncharacterized protein n=1 Tax=Thalictrum thalictroides TaxID=46969 RepID=A0A7J6X2R1_THATH|nr:hypothetical protein FRX31_007046 [Thalictrum thalictroides]
MEGEGVWNLHLRRSLFRESEWRELQSLNDILGEVVLNEEKDEWEWIWAKEKSFTVMSFYNQLWFSKQSDEREEESTLHLFQGCTVTSELWRRLCGNSQAAAQLLQEQGGVTGGLWLVYGHGWLWIRGVSLVAVFLGLHMLSEWTKFQAECQHSSSSKREGMASSFSLGTAATGQCSSRKTGQSSQVVVWQRHRAQFMHYRTVILAAMQHNAAGQSYWQQCSTRQQWQQCSTMQQGSHTRQQHQTLA